MSEILYSFRETSWFTDRVSELLTDDEYNKLQWRLIEFPDAGDVIKGKQRHPQNTTIGERQRNSRRRAGDILFCGGE